MSSPSSWSAALRHTTAQAARRRPLSLQLPSLSSSSSSSYAVRWASIVPYSVNEHVCYSPPPPPMTLEQVQQYQHRKQQSLLEEQIQLEQRQRMRQQRELQLELSKHRNAILEQQQKKQQQQQQQQQQHFKQAKQELEQQRQITTDDKDVWRNQLQQQQQQHQAGDTKEPLMARGVIESPAQLGQEEEPRQEAASTEETPSSSSSQASCRQYVATRHRSMFGYRGPEHAREIVAAVVEENEVFTIAATTTEGRIPFMITAEKRVRLALMDYTPKQIDAMTPAQAQAILFAKEGGRKKQEGQNVFLGLRMDHSDESEHCATVCAKSLAPPSFESVVTDEEYAMHVVADVMGAPRTAAAVRALPSNHGQHPHDGHATQTSSSSRQPSGNPSSSSSSPSGL